MEDVKHSLTRPIGFDCVMRVRSSTGLRPTGFYGAFFMSNTTDIELGNIDSDKAIAVEVKHDDKLRDDENAFFQVCLTRPLAATLPDTAIHRLLCCTLICMGGENYVFITYL